MARNAQCERGHEAFYSRKPWAGNADHSNKMVQSRKHSKCFCSIFKHFEKAFYQMDTINQLRAVRGCFKLQGYDATMNINWCENTASPRNSIPFSARESPTLNSVPLCSRGKYP